MNKYRMYSYEVWGNDEDGYEVNDICQRPDTVVIPCGMNDIDLLTMLKDEGWLERIHGIEITGEDGYTLYFADEYNSGKPLFELRKVEE